MTKTELLADLATRFAVVIQTEKISVNGENPSWWRSVVFETAVLDDVPVGKRREIKFYVLNIDQPTEQAFYDMSVPENILVTPE